MGNKARLYEYRARRVPRSFAQEGTRLLGPDDAVALFRRLTKGEPREMFMTAHLNVRGMLVAYEIVAVGASSGVEVHPREVFRNAIIAGSHSIVVAHNHPSGDHDPSAEDMLLTSRLVEAGQLLGIPVLDHLIVTETDHTSLAHLCAH